MRPGQLLDHITEFYAHAVPLVRIVLPHAGGAERHAARERSVKNRVYCGIYCNLLTGGVGQYPKVLVILTTAAQSLQPKTRGGFVEAHCLTPVDQQPVPVLA